MKRNIRQQLALGGLGLISTALVPAFALNLPVNGAALPVPDDQAQGTLSVTESLAAGSGSLVPLMAADTQMHELATIDAPANGGAPVSQPVDDLQFVSQATESARKEIKSAQDALPQLKNPELKQIAQMLVSDHGAANERLSKLADTKGWPVPGPRASAAPPSGTASSDFDAKWTADMIAGHERSVALYRAEAQSGEDQDLRNYARETLPTIERHLTRLRSLQK